MNLDELKTAWKCQDKPDFAQLDPYELDQYLKAEQARFSRVMFWTDVFVVAALGSAAVYFFMVYSGMKIVWPSYLAVVLLLGAAFYLPWRNRQRRKTEKRFDRSLRDELRKNSAQLASQIRFSVWSGIWVYILPLITALSLLHWQTYLNYRSGIDAFRKNVLSDILLGLFVYGVFWLSAQKMRKDKRKIDLELESLGCPEPEEKTPMIHSIVRTLLAIGVKRLAPDRRSSRLPRSTSWVRSGIRRTGRSTGGWKKFEKAATTRVWRWRSWATAASSTKGRSDTRT